MFVYVILSIRVSIFSMLYVSPRTSDSILDIQSKTGEMFRQFFYLPTSLKKYTTNIIYQLPIWYITKSNRYLDNVVIHHMELEEPAAMPCMIHIFFSFFLLKMSTQCICHLSQFSIFVFLTYFQTLIFQEFEIQNNRSSRHHSF